MRTMVTPTPRGPASDSARASDSAACLFAGLTFGGPQCATEDVKLVVERWVAVHLVTAAQSTVGLRWRQIEYSSDPRVQQRH
eukprot:m.174959 g.174959  ORF g.174959 m.174959 type:complete len:82 (+) comp14885_c3_seq2:1557-1802(+)